MNDFPSADELKKTIFSLEEWLKNNSEDILSSLKTKRSAVTKEINFDDDRQEVIKFFQSKGYEVLEIKDQRGERTGKISIRLD